MRSMFFDRSKPSGNRALVAVGALGVLGLLGALLSGATPALAGEKLTLEEIASRAQGAAVVKVTLGRGKAPGTVQVVRILRGLPADLQATTDWLSLCLPDRTVLRRWTIEQAKWPARPLWRRALARGHYQAVVLVGKDHGGALSPQCGVEAMQMQHTDLAPGYARYLESVEAVLQR
jgi:hypothetical protein